MRKAMTRRCGRWTRCISTISSCGAGRCRSPFRKLAALVRHTPPSPPRLTRGSMRKRGKLKSQDRPSRKYRADCRVMGERSDAVLRTAVPGNDSDVRCWHLRKLRTLFSDMRSHFRDPRGCSTPFVPGPEPGSGRSFSPLRGRGAERRRNKERLRGAPHRGVSRSRAALPGSDQRANLALSRQHWRRPSVRPRPAT
jgi:hypothetical protein